MKHIYIQHEKKKNGFFFIKKRVNNQKYKTLAQSSDDFAQPASSGRLVDAYRDG